MQDMFGSQQINALEDDVIHADHYALNVGLIPTIIARHED